MIFLIHYIRKIFNYKHLMKEINQTIENIAIVPPKRFQMKEIQQLNLKTRKGDEEDFNELRIILTQMLSYPSISLTELHMNSDRLGLRDLREVRQSSFDANQATRQRGLSQFCPCCGFVRQENTLKICTNLRDINNIGISTYMFFQTIKNLIILLVIMTFVYSIYALINNSRLIRGFNYISIDLLDVQNWLRVVLLVVWNFALFILRYFDMKSAKQVDQLFSASHFTLMLENAPLDLTKQELQEVFKQHQRSFNRNNVNHLLKITKINKVKPFSLNENDLKDEQFDEIKKQRKKLRQTFVQWVKQRQKSQSFGTTKQERFKKYDQFQQLTLQQAKKAEEIRYKIEKKILQETNEKQTTFFVTFQTRNAVKLIDSSLQNSFTCCNKFQFRRRNQNYKVNIGKAPQPEDIIWSNFGVPLCKKIKRKIITFTITIVLLGISFIIFLGITNIQIYVSKDLILTIIKAFVISIFNCVIPYVIKKLTIYEMNQTVTKYEISVAKRSVVAIAINSIFIPLIVNIVFINDFYKEEILAFDVFVLSFTNSFLLPIVKLINMSEIVFKFKKYLATSPRKRLGLNQKQLNQICENIDFQIGHSYQFFLSLFFFICFFVLIQPIIPIIAICGMVMMYLIEKYKVLNRKRRPAIGTDLTDERIFQVILYGGLVYFLGTITWFILRSRINVLPNSILFLQCIAMLFLPYKKIVPPRTRQQETADSYKKCRIFFQSDYDILNPFTSASASEQNKKFYDDQHKKFQKASQAEQKQFTDLYKKQNAKGRLRIPTQMIQCGNYLPTIPLRLLPEPMFIPAPSRLEIQLGLQQIVLRPNQQQNFMVELPSLNGLNQ